MRNRRVAVLTLAFFCAACSASAQGLSIQFQGGRVRLVAQNVTIGRILEEWTRVGGTTIVDGDRITEAPLTLELTDVPERQALEVLLRGVAGYIATARGSTFARQVAFRQGSRASDNIACPRRPGCTCQQVRSATGVSPGVGAAGAHE